MKYLHSTYRYAALALISAGLQIHVNAEIPLLGYNGPHKNINDGDFGLIRSSKRQLKQSPFWTKKYLPGKGKGKIGIEVGSMASTPNSAHIDSRILDHNPAYSTPKAGDVLNWSFSADALYDVKANVSLALVFGDHQRIVADNAAIKGGDLQFQRFEGTYTITKEDAKAGMPFVRIIPQTEKGVRVFIDYVNVSVVDKKTDGPEAVQTTTVSNGIKINWTDATPNVAFAIYRAESKYNKWHNKTPLKHYKLVKKGIKGTEFVDTTIINGLEYFYLVTRTDNNGESSASKEVSYKKIDTIPPKAPHAVTTREADADITLSWKTSNNDIAGFHVYRGDKNGKNFYKRSTHLITEHKFDDLTPIKGTVNTYKIKAVDHSGNESDYSDIVSASVKAVRGASFIDLIEPMPIHKALSSDIWGADGVVPRDPDNGIEDSEWSYWGGRPMKDKDGKYHMQVVRWPEGGLRGHWDWPYSTVSYAVSDKPTGPYKVKRDIAYDYKKGKGHNADVTQLNDGRFLLYSLIDWKPCLFTSDSMAGPWKLEGEMTVDYTFKGKMTPKKKQYQYLRNLSGVQLDDGGMLFVTKKGGMIKSDKGLLGPYTIVSGDTYKNTTIPKRDRKLNYEDPVMWKDDVQFHMIINAFLAYRAIYLRSPDGINWKCETGFAFTPDSTSYEDGTRTAWYKLERPHIIQDDFGRATHLSLAAVDVPKDLDLSKDKHSSKNLIMPLTVHKRLKMLNKQTVTQNTKSIKVRIISEPGFNAHSDVDIKSLRFGGSEAVNFGGGAKVISSVKNGNDLVVEFDGTTSGLTDKNFACKMIGKTKNGGLIVGFTKRTGE